MDEILKKHSDIIKKLKEKRIVNIKLDRNNTPYLIEMCDEYFCMDLTKDNCNKLAELFRELADKF